MIRLFNKAAHLGIGVWVGWNYRNPASWQALAVFGGYQVVEAWRKRDKGYPEIKEFGIGYAVGLTVRWLRENAKKAKKSARNAWLGL